MAYVGNNLTVQQYAPTISYLSGNGSTTAFTLPIAVVSAAQILVFIENVPQNPSTAFSVSGTTLTFTSAPPSGTNNVWVEYTSLQTNTIAPSAGTVQNSSFGNLTSIPFAVGGPLGGGNASAMKNRIINGAMVIDQRNAGASVTPTTSNNVYPVDRFVTYASQASKYTAQQNAGSVTPPVGFNNYLGFTSSSAYSITSSDYFLFGQKIEGFNTADLGWGTANAKTVTLSFQVYSSLTGTFGGTFRNSANNRSYVFSYTISSANTWTSISVTVAGDTTGTWVGATNGTGIEVIWSLGTGSTLSTSAGTWNNSVYFSATGATSVVGTNTATFYITGVQLEVGSSATGYEYRQYGMELMLCQRYYQLTGGYFAGTQAGNETNAVGSCNVQVYMRASPTATLPAGASFHRPGIAFYAASSVDIGPSANGNGYQVVVIAAGAGTSTMGQLYSGLILSAEL